MLDDMPVYRQSPLRALKSRLQLRSLICGAVLILVLWVWYHRHSPPPQEHLDLDVPTHIWDKRAGRVREAFQHGYRSYEKYAAPHDEVLPLSAGYKDK